MSERETWGNAGGGGGGGGRRSGGGGSEGGGGGMGKLSLIPAVFGLALILGVVYGGYVWFIKRVVVPQGNVLVLLKKYGTQSLPGDTVVVPTRPKDEAAAGEWEKTYGEANGVLEEVYQEGTYFGFSPFDYEREVVPIVSVPSDKVGLVVRKFGTALAEGQVLADVNGGQRGPLAEVLQPGVYPQYSNRYAYEVILVDPVIIDRGERGVVTIMAGPLAKKPNEFLVGVGEQGTQPVTEPEGRRLVNLFQKRITPIPMRSQQFQMQGEDGIRFPSADSFEIRMEGFVEWSILPDRLPLIYVQYAEGGGLVDLLEERVILPYSRSFSRTVGSKYLAREFISGDTRLKFQQEFEEKLKQACLEQGIEIRQALVRDIVPPEEIRGPINEREVARQQILTIEQQIKVARSQADLTRQTETAVQNQRIGDATKGVVTIVKASERERDIAITQAKQRLEVAKLQLDAAKKQAEALVSRGAAEADVLLLQKRAEAEPLKRQVEAFGGGEAFAQFYFFQKVAPSIRSILTSTEGPFGEIFSKLANSSAASRSMPATRPSGEGR